MRSFRLVRGEGRDVCERVRVHGERGVARGREERRQPLPQHLRGRESHTRASLSLHLSVLSISTRFCISICVSLCLSLSISTPQRGEVDAGKNNQILISEIYTQDERSGEGEGRVGRKAPPGRGRAPPP